MPEQVSFGLIGFGAWGRHHANALAKAPGGVLRAIATATEASAAAAREAFPNATVYTDYRRPLEDPQIDVVDVVAPTYLHRQLAGDALRAGKHLLLEKPMAPSVAECDELIQLASDSDRLLAIGHEFRLSSL